MPKFIVGVIATAVIEVEADTQEEAEVLAITDPCLSNSAEWDIDYCKELDEDDDDDENDEDDDDF